MIRVVIAVLIRLYRVVPVRFTFACLVLSEHLGVPARKAQHRAFVAVAAGRNPDESARPLRSWFADRFPEAEAIVLYGIEAYRPVCDLVAPQVRPLSSRTCEIWGRSLFELGRFKEAREVIASQPASQRHPGLSQLLGQLDLIEGDIIAGTSNLEWAIAGDISLFCPHQNLAARSSSSYFPTRLDVLSGPDGMLFDAYNYIGQRLTHVGEGQLSAGFYRQALEAQRRLKAAMPVPLSPALEALLARLQIRLEELRIFPVEWYTQIGHQGMLDMLFRMQEIGWWQGKAVFLVPPGVVANKAFQTLFDRFGATVLTDSNHTVARELFSLQRWYGLNFNAFELPSGEVVPWQEAGAKMMLEWDRAGRGSPLREIYDEIFAASYMYQAAAEAWRKTSGMGRGDWYVCLHMRDASHYGEIAGTGQTHRNTGLEQYLKAIAYITGRGGWVVKLGGPRSPKLPSMPRVIDYARSDARSEIMDIHLIRHAHFFIGTTSGLTNVAVSFGVPCALVNCITTDAQLWGDRVRFALKRIRLRDGTEVSQRELTATPWRWRVFGADVLARYGATLIENSADEILETVKEVEALADGEPARYTSTVAEAADLLVRWRQSLTLPHFYGAGQPSLHFLGQHAAALLAGTAPAPAARELETEPLSS